MRKLSISRTPLRFWVIRPTGQNRCVGLLMNSSGAVEAETQEGAYPLVRNAIEAGPHRGLPLLPDPEAAKARRIWNRHVRHCRALGLPNAGGAHA